MTTERDERITLSGYGDDGKPLKIERDEFALTEPLPLGPASLGAPEVSDIVARTFDGKQAWVPAEWPARERMLLDQLSQARFRAETAEAIIRKVMGLLATVDVR